jgi:hypothetical protein
MHQADILTHKMKPTPEELQKAQQKILQALQNG